MTRLWTQPKFQPAVSGFCELCSRRGYRPLGGFCQSAKTSRVVDCDISKNFAVQFDPGLFQAADKPVVADAVLLGGCADAHNPDGAILTLFQAAARVGKLETAFHGFFGSTIEF